MSAPIRSLMRPPTRSRAGALTPGGVELVALGIALASAVVLVWPARVSIPAVARAAVTPPARPSAVASGDSVREVIVATNLFSGARRAPRERFLLPGTESVADVPPAPLPFGASAPDAGPRLFGIVQVDGAARALVQLANDSTPRLVMVGDRMGPWRVVRIGADRVDMQSSSGTRTLRLSRRSPSDSSGSPP